MSRQSTTDDLVDFVKKAHDSEMSYGQYQAMMYANKIVRKPINTPVAENTDAEPKKKLEIYTSHSKRFC